MNPWIIAAAVAFLLYQANQAKVSSPQMPAGPFTKPLGPAPGALPGQAVDRKIPTGAPAGPLYRALPGLADTATVMRPPPAPAPGRIVTTAPPTAVPPVATTRETAEPDPSATFLPVQLGE